MLVNLDEPYSRLYAGRLPTEPTDDEFTKLPPTHIRLTVVDAKNLANTDAHEGGVSDPFCIVTFTDMRGGPYDTEMYKTTVCKETLNPVWNEEFSLPLKPGDAGCAARVEVWDADKDTGKDFLGAVRLQLDGASGSKELELGPRLVIAEELVKEKYAPTGPAKKAKQGSVKLKWQYERNSSVKQDADWCVNRGNVALTHGKYHVAETLYHEAYALDPSIDLDALLNNLGSTRRIHKSGIKEDILDTPLSEEQLKARFRQLDVDNNGFLYKQEFRRFYATQEVQGVPDLVVDELLTKYNMLGDERLSFEEFSILMLKLAQR